MVEWKWSHFAKEIILWDVQWCVASPISDRHNRVPSKLLE